MQAKLRKLWRHYYKDVGGVIFVVDSCDHNRFEEAKGEIQVIRFRFLAIADCA